MTNEEPGAFRKAVKSMFGPSVKPCPGSYRGRKLMEREGYPAYECMCPDGTKRDCTCYNEKDKLCTPEGFVRLPVL